MENNTISEITKKMRAIADLVQRNQANQPGADTVARCRKIERSHRAAELRMLADEIDAAAARLVSELTYNAAQELMDGLRGLILTREQISGCEKVPGPNRAVSGQRGEANESMD